MKLNLLNLSIALFFIMCGTNLNAQTTDSNISVLPKWKKGNVHTMKIKVATTDEGDGGAKTFTSTYTALFNILDVSESGYRVEWTYTSAQIDPLDPLAENHLFENLLNVKIKMDLKKSGKFHSITNADEVRAAANEILNKLIPANAGNQQMLIQLNLAKTLLGTSQGMETVLKQIKIYFAGYGYSYQPGTVLTRDVEIPNPLGAEPFTAVEKVEVKKLDTSTGIIESSKIVDGEAVKVAVVAYLKKISPTTEHSALDAELEKVKMDFSEKGMQQYHFSSGIVRKTSFSRIMKLGVQNRAMIWEFDCVD